jgi:hypothetical protein
MFAFEAFDLPRHFVNSRVDGSKYAIRAFFGAQDKPLSPDCYLSDKSVSGISGSLGIGQVYPAVANFVQEPLQSGNFLCNVIVDFVREV